MVFSLNGENASEKRRRTDLSKISVCVSLLRFGPHRDSNCKLVQGVGTINHEQLRLLHDRNKDRRPATLDQWQYMFQEIYPREADDRARSTIGLFEELGEIAEAIRVFDKYPMYFLSEAADIFSYLMGIANEHLLRTKQEHGHDFSLMDEFLKRYAGYVCSAARESASVPPCQKQP